MSDFNTMITETSYLSAQNFVQYRTIMRKIFIENENYHDFLYPEEIFDLVKDCEGFEGYTLMDLKQDLDQLVNWKNLIAVQDPGVVRTIAEYKNKQFRYSMSQRAIEVERLTVRLENLDIEKGNLSTNYFLRIESALKNAEKVNNMSLQEVNEWWNMLHEDFKAMSQNYHDYLQEFNNPNSKNIMQSVEFILHKDRFIQYLKNFIKQMQLESRKIRSLLESVNVLFETTLLNKVVKSEMEMPRASKNKIEEEELTEKVQNQWIAFERWFKPINGRKAECDKIFDITNEIIRSIIENANMIVQMNNYGVSRKDDYRHFIEMFLHSESMDDAHCLAAHIFGVQELEHFRLIQTVDTEDSKVSAFQRDENVMRLESHSRTYREKRAKEGVVNREMEKMMARVKYEEETKKKNSLVEKYIHDGKLNVAEIQDIIPSEVRMTILGWIAVANMNVSRTGNTELGKKFKLIKQEGTCVLKCADGNLTMPRYILEFME